MGIYNMAERRKSRKRKDEVASIDPEAAKDKPTKEEYAVAKWIRNNVPSKKTKFDRNHNVEYFTGTRAVDALLENSPWTDNKFKTREQVIKFLDTMLRHKFFHRAKKVVISEEELNKIRGIKKKVKEVKDTKDTKDVKDLKDVKDTKDVKEGKDTKDVKDGKDGKEAKEGKDVKDGKDGKDGNQTADAKDGKDEKKPGEKERKPKVRLEMHMEQYFVDCNDAYVWIYEPIPVYYWFFGTLVVLGAIGVCLFPLWPPTIRHGVYYLSVAAAGFLVFILTLVIIRMIVFCLLWILTLGRCHLWLLPNLTADVGFFASFWPLYQYDYYGLPSDNQKKSSKKKRKKEKDSDSEEAPTLSSEEKPSTTDLPKDDTGRIEDVSNGEDKKSTTDAGEGEEGSEEGSESEKSNTSRDFVML